MKSRSWLLAAVAGGCCALLTLVGCSSAGPVNEPAPVVPLEPVASEDPVAVSEPLPVVVTPPIPPEPAEPAAEVSEPAAEVARLNEPVAEAPEPVAEDSAPAAQTDGEQQIAELGGEDAAPEGEEATPAAVPSGPPTEQSIFELQIAVYVRPETAANAAERLNDRGFDSYVVESVNPEGEPRYTIRLGPYATMAEAQEAAADYRTRAGAQGIIRWRPRPEGSG